jgi:hypothetical protein
VTDPQAVKPQSPPPSGEAGGAVGDQASGATKEPLANVLARLRSPAVIRTRCRQVLAAVAAGDSGHFTFEPSRLPDAADRVVQVTRRRYPDLAVPYHSRWRHFEAGGIDRHGPLRRQLVERHGGDRKAAARALVDLAVVSVLLDAGAGAAWRWHEPGTSLEMGRSEGLALASFAGFRAGAFSSDPDEPLRVDAGGLQRLTEADLGRIFQVAEHNPLVGLAGRARLMNALGDALAADTSRFGKDGRPGGLIDSVGGGGDTVSAPAILESVLVGLAAIWPGGRTLGGAAVGDCWRHRLATPADYLGLDAGWVPFHKLSQWLTYSLLEPFGWAGKTVTDLEQLTGLPEYRNGGLLLDTGVLTLVDPRAAMLDHDVGSELVVEWRALTVALIDVIADLVRSRLQAPQLPLAAVLEGGTWAAGRELAFARRSGQPPLTIVSDGTVF